MKKYCFLLVTGCLLGFVSTKGQQVPEWTRLTTSLPADTAYIGPVRVLTDALSNIYMLSRYVKSGPGGTVRKIYLEKFHPDSTREWSLVYDSTAQGEPLAYDLALDA